MHRISEKEKIRRGYGTGDGNDYEAYVHAREFNSQGTTVLLPDYKTGRPVELLSHNEMYCWYLLRFDSDVEEIKEQYPLDLKITTALANQHNIRHPRNNHTHMTTDFVVTHHDGSKEAISLKKSRAFNDRTKEKLFLEKAYWDALNTPFRIVIGDDLDIVKAQNIRMCSYYYHPESISDEIDCLKYMIIHQELDIDLSSKPIIPRLVFEKNKERVFARWSSLRQQQLNPGC